MPNAKVIYTSLTKGYDDLRQPETVRPDYDYICFSNDLGEKDIGVWKIRKIHYDNPSAIRLTRFPKLNPHLVLPEYVSSVWTDANLTITDVIYRRVDELIAAGSICALSEHSKRVSVYQEADALMHQGFGEPWLVYRQVQFMLEQGFTKPTRLPVCSLIFRRHMDPRVIAFSRVWWEQYCRFSCRDQMSVNYALAQAGIDATPFLLPETVTVLTQHHLRNVAARRHFTALRLVGTLPPRIVRRLWRELLRLRLRRMYCLYGLPKAYHQP